MTQPQDPRKHPLQDDEIALARVLRALPAGEPPAQLDAAILKAATDALAAGEAGATRARKPANGLRWLPTWAIGSAAAAVLAVGVGLQLRPPLAPSSLPQATFENARPDLPEARERMSVDLAEPERELKPMPGPPPAEPSLSRQPPAAPPPPPAPLRDLAPAAPAPAAAAPVPATEAVAEDAGVFAPPPEAFPSAQSENRAMQREEQDSPETLDSIVVSGTRLRADGSIDDTAGAAAGGDADADRRQAQPQADKAEAPRPVLPPVAEDAKLSPRDWLERIRERRNQGDRASARASLQLFIRTHPDAPIPTDLAQLR